MAQEQADRLDIPKHLQYSEDHVWVDDSVEPAVIGITEYAAERMGDIVFVDLPQVDTHIEAGDELMQLESAKAVEPVISPVAGTVKYVNREAEDDAAIINDDPYGEGWLVKIELDDDMPELLSAEEYAAIITK
ncbi:glycine cleavage system protein GcvH [uncultured Bifidobacterium sp.]|uniref:glycine cleavage system protein GcvH n=1 Tax=uncultured Bifidobacterium sp. TaxID=165187 RepID=UPI00258E48DA|nr:glycine cleavage system protein GcvH [uncultured Bifidobacterium sp.]MEE0654374.1 glycine cleavage system protein GcvH [Bifidobacterium criceti]